jgi:ActR/RegA family two-component response regulator
VKAPTRALIVEDIENWQYTLERAARRAGASEVVVCKDLQTVKDALRKARFDVALLDIGLAPEDDLNVDGIKVLEAIREIDGSGTRCILVTGWAGDRLDLQAQAQQKFGVDWSYMKEKYDAHTVIAKLNELLEQAPALRLSQKTPMGNLCANVQPYNFEEQLLSGLSPNGGVNTLYTLAARLLGSAIPLVAIRPEMPMEKGEEGDWFGVYWSRALATAVAVGFGSFSGWRADERSGPADLLRLLPGGVAPDLIESVRERDLQGRLWELPEFDRDNFPG